MPKLNLSLAIGNYDRVKALIGVKVIGSRSLYGDG